MILFVFFVWGSLTEIREHRFRREDAECEFESEMHLTCQWDSLAVGNMELRSI